MLAALQPSQSNFKTIDLTQSQSAPSCAWIRIINGNRRETAIIFSTNGIFKTSSDESFHCYIDFLLYNILIALNATFQQYYTVADTFTCCAQIVITNLIMKLSVHFETSQKLLFEKVVCGPRSHSGKKCVVVED